MKRTTLFVLGLSAALAAAGLATGPASAAGPHTVGPGNQPYASYWHPSTILSWDPATDPDARFNRSHVPLQPRTVNPDLRANSNAHAGEGKIASLVSFGPTSANPSQGALTSNYYA